MAIVSDYCAVASPIDLHDDTVAILREHAGNPHVRADIAGLADRNRVYRELCP